MNILVIGGYGTIGAPLCKSLFDKENNIFIIDSFNLEEDFPNYKFLSDSLYSLISTINENKIDIIYNLIEDTKVDNKFHHNLYQTNLISTMLILNASVITNTKCIFCNWYENFFSVYKNYDIIKEYSIDSFIYSVLADKKKLMYYYSNYTNIVNVEMPRLVDFNEPISNMFSILSNFYKSITNNKPSLVSNEVIFEDHYYRWTDMSTIIYTLSHDSIINVSGTKPKNIPKQIKVPYIEYKITELISIILDMLDINEEIIIQSRQSNISVKRKSYDGSERYINAEKFIRSAIDRLS